MGDSAPPLRDPWALSESARRRLVTVARQQHLPKGWLAERRSGGHYIIFNPAGDRFTSLTAAKQQAKRDEDARARARTSLARSFETSIDRGARVDVCGSAEGDAIDDVIF